LLLDRTIADQVAERDSRCGTWRLGDDGLGSESVGYVKSAIVHVVSSSSHDIVHQRSSRESNPANVELKVQCSALLLDEQKVPVSLHWEVRHHAFCGKDAVESRRF